MERRLEATRVIHTSRPKEAAWRYLRHFHDVDYCTDLLRRLQQIPESVSLKNVTKQARQVGYCMRQAEEYFRSAESVGLATMPVLLYYGMVAMSNAIILMHGSGDLSFDRRRQLGRHKHHGLNYIGPSKLSKPSKPEVRDVLDSIKVSIHTNSSTDAEGKSIQVPWGQFPLLYEHLWLGAVPTEVTRRFKGKSAIIRTTENLPSCSAAEIHSLVGRKLSVLDLILNLPDLYSDLLEIGLYPTLARGSIRREYYYETMQENGDWPLSKETTDYFVDCHSSTQASKIKTLFGSLCTNLRLDADLGRNLKFLYERVQNDSEEPRAVYVPDVVESSGGHLHYVQDPKTYCPEFGALFATMFALSMAARYHPDIWMFLLEQRTLSAELLRSVLELVQRKAPSMILSQMTGRKYVFRR